MTAFFLGYLCGVLFSFGWFCVRRLLRVQVRHPNGSGDGELFIITTAEKDQP